MKNQLKNEREEEGEEENKMTGIILFRAQPFHNGHLAQIKRAYEDIAEVNGKLYIFVGSADKSGTKRNPLPIDLRLDLIEGSLNECFSSDWKKYIYIVPLNDLSDEANNTHSWGYYLLNQIKSVVNDDKYIFYYSDRPEIALSWFNEELCKYIYFSFLPRVNNLNATHVRDLIEYEWYDDLRSCVPPYVCGKAKELHEYIINAK